MPIHDEGSSEPAATMRSIRCLLLLSDIVFIRAAFSPALDLNSFRYHAKESETTPIFGDARWNRRRGHSLRTGLLKESLSKTKLLEGSISQSRFQNRYDKRWNTSFTVLTIPASCDLYPGNRDTAVWNSSPCITARTRFIGAVSRSCFRQTNR